MNDLIINIFVFVGVIIIVAIYLYNGFNESEQAQKKRIAKEAEERMRHSDAVKNGIRNSKLYGTKKERRNRIGF